MDFLFGLFSKIKDNIIVILIMILLVLINDAFFIGSFYLMKSNEAKVVSGSNIINSSNTNRSTVKVDIKGEVKKPGVYEMDDSSIVNDVIKKAGGTKKNASTNNINLSKKVYDEMVIVISTKKSLETKSSNTKITNDASITGDATITTNGNVDDVNLLVNINTASLEELSTLSGIGLSKAEAIITYRNENKFSTVEDIKKVPGIGDTLFDKIKDHISI